MGDVVDAVQILFAFLIKHVLPLGSHYFDGIRSKENFAWGPRNNERKHSGLLVFSLLHEGHDKWKITIT